MGPEDHIVQNFGEDLVRLEAIGVPGSFGSQDSWGLVFKSHYDFESQYFPLQHPELNVSTVLELVRPSLIKDPRLPTAALQPESSCGGR